MNADASGSGSSNVNNSDNTNESGLPLDNSKTLLEYIENLSKNKSDEIFRRTGRVSNSHKLYSLGFARSEVPEEIKTCVQEVIMSDPELSERLGEQRRGKFRCGNITSDQLTTVLKNNKDSSAVIQANATFLNVLNPVNPAANPDNINRSRVPRGYTNILDTNTVSANQ
jgi:hypothetical protein